MIIKHLKFSNLFQHSNVPETHTFLKVESSYKTAAIQNSIHNLLIRLSELLNSGYHSNQP